MSKIDRKQWVQMFKRGFKRGAAERKKTPENRRDKLSKEIDNSVDTDADLAAFSAGYEEGKSNAFPGADINIEDRANTAYDRSEYSAGLDEWS